MKFTFLAEDEDLEITIRTDDIVTWPEAVDKFFYFLRGCSYPIRHSDWVDKWSSLLQEWEEAEDDVRSGPRDVINRE